MNNVYSIYIISKKKSYAFIDNDFYGFLLSFSFFPQKNNYLYGNSIWMIEIYNVT